MSKIRAIFLDFDGTLVSFKTHRVPDSAREALMRARAQGIKIFLATGRPRPFVKQLEGMEFDGMVTVNGAACFAADGTVIYNQPIDQQDIERMVRYCREHPFPIVFAGNDRAIVCDKNSNLPAYEEIMSLLALPPQEECPLEEALGMEVQQMVAFFPQELEQMMTEQVLHDCMAVRWHPVFADCTKRGVNKGAGIEAVCRYFGIDLREAVAFGDGENDIQMLQQAGVGVAMGQAPEVVKQAANLVTDTCDNDGIAKMLNQLL